MAQIAGKWITDGAITSSKIDTSSTFTFQGIRITQDASVIGDLTVNGTIALPNATVNKYLYINASHEVEYNDATSGAPAHGITLNTAPVAEDTTGWRNSAFSMSADDSTAYITQDASVIGNFTVDGTMTLPSATINKFLYVNASHAIEYADATGSGSSAHGVAVNTLPVAEDSTGWRDSGYSMSADDATAYATAPTSMYLTTNTRNLISLVGDPAAYGNAIALTTGSGNGVDRTSSIIIEGSPYTTSSINLKTGYINATADSSQNQAIIYMDSRFPGTEGAIIHLITGNAQIAQSASMIPYDNERISMSVPHSFVYIDSGSGGTMQLCTGDTTYQGSGASGRVAIRANSSYINTRGGQVDIIAGTTDTSHARIILNGASGTSNSISMYVDSDRVRGGSITLQAGYLGGIDDVPINILTDNNMIIGRSTSTNTNQGSLLANFGGQIYLKSWTSSLTLYGYGGVYLDYDTTVNGASVYCMHLKSYADNTEAISYGLTAGALYYTGDVVKVVHA